MSSKKPHIEDVEKAFSKVEKSIAEIGQAIPKDAEQILIKPAERMLSFEPMKQMAAWYINAAEEIAVSGIKLQEQGAKLIKNTPWGTFLEAHAGFTSFARGKIRFAGT